MPRAYDCTDDKGYQPSVLLTGEADLKTTPQQVVTYHINPKAVWRRRPADHLDRLQVHVGPDRPRQGHLRHHRLRQHRVGGRHRSAHRCRHLQTPYPDWKVLFGGNLRGLPEPSAGGQGPRRPDEGRLHLLRRPWKLDHWTKGSEIKLVPEPDVLGQEAQPEQRHLQVHHRHGGRATRTTSPARSWPPIRRPNPAAKRSRARPAPSTTPSPACRTRRCGSTSRRRRSTSHAVRQALAYATDRDAIVKQLFAPIQPDIKPINSFYTPAFGKVYTEPFGKYQPDLTWSPR